MLLIQVVLLEQMLWCYHNLICKETAYAQQGYTNSQGDLLEG